MSIPAPAAPTASNPQGTDPGWAMTFFREGDTTGQPREISVADYHASIDVTLPHGLQPGEFTLKIEGLLDEHYAELVTGPGQAPLNARLYLFWRDANASVLGYLSSLAGQGRNPHERPLVAVLRVTKVSRSAGQNTYDTEITAVDRAYVQLAAPSAERGQPVTAADYRAALRLVASATGADIRVHPPGEVPLTPARGGTAGDERVIIGGGRPHLDVVARIGEAVAHATNSYGRGMVLLRDGAVHVGRRPVPFQEPAAGGGGLLGAVAGALPGGADQLVSILDHRSGLLAAVEKEPVELGPEATPARRRTWALTLRGRPDLKPGDVVSFEPPPAAEGTILPGVGQALLGTIAAPLLPAVSAGTAATLLYLHSVRHAQSRTTGFTTTVEGVTLASTTVTGVTLPTTDAAWDRLPPSGPEPTPARGSTNPAEAAAAGIRRVAGLAQPHLLEVGEVRAVATEVSGAVEPPAQTETVHQGLVPDGRRHEARRRPVRTDGATAQPGTSYLTPFAWGGCGLVLPRYPGTRVALAFRNGKVDDPLDVGALWPAGHAPVSEPGDLWLSLPVGVPAQRRTSLPEGTTAGDHEGKVAHDLIDADGNRVIELGELTVRVGREQLRGRGQRPERAADADSITIEHVGGEARIVLTQDGTILLRGKKIELDAGDGSINLTAQNVDVKVAGSMEVHG